MHRTKHSARSPSTSSSERAPTRSSAKSPISSDYEYVGRLVTRERAVNRKSKSIQQQLKHHTNEQKYYHSSSSYRKDGYEEVQVGSGNEDDDGLSQPLGVIRINDRHFREIYRLPTPPPKVKRVFHRLRSPEPKIIERVYVRRPAPQIIENVIEVPPEKVKIIHREKYLDNAKPITRSKLVRLKAQEDEDVPSTTYVPSGHYQTVTRATPTITSNPIGNSQSVATEGATTALVYPPQSNLRTVGYIQSDIPPHIMLQSQQPIQIPQQANTQTMTSAVPTNFQYSNQPTIQAANAAVPAGFQYSTQPNMSVGTSLVSSGFQYPTQQPQTVPSGLFGYRQY